MAEDRLTVLALMLASCTDITVTPDAVLDIFFRTSRRKFNQISMEVTLQFDTIDQNLYAHITGFYLHVFRKVLSANAIVLTRRTVTDHFNWR